MTHERSRERESGVGEEKTGEGRDRGESREEEAGRLLVVSPATLASSAENTTSAPVCCTLSTSHVVTVRAAVGFGMAVGSFQLTTLPY